MTKEAEQQARPLEYLERTSEAYFRISEIVKKMVFLFETAQYTYQTQVKAEISGITLKFIEWACFETLVGSNLGSLRFRLQSSPETINFIREHLIIKKEPPKIVKNPTIFSNFHPGCRIITHETTSIPDLYLETGLLGKDTPATQYLVGSKWVAIGNQ